MMTPDALRRFSIYLTLAAPTLPTFFSEAAAAPIFGQSPLTQFFLGTALRSFGLFQNSSGGGRDLEVWTAPLIATGVFAIFGFRPGHVPLFREFVDAIIMWVVPGMGTMPGMGGFGGM